MLKNAQFAALNAQEVDAVAGGRWYTVEVTETIAASSDTDGGASRLVERTVTERYWIS